MMVLSPLDEELYESKAVEISYYKLFPYIMDDFLTRKDCEQMMKSTNLPVTTTVSTIVNTAVQVAVPAGTGTGVGAGNGEGAGQTTPVYIGTTPLGGSRILAKEKEALKEAGGVAIQATIGEI